MLGPSLDPETAPGDSELAFMTLPLSTSQAKEKPYTGRTANFIFTQGVGVSVLAITVVASLLATLICYAIFGIYDWGEISQQTRLLALPPLVPLIITPPIAYVLVRSTLRLEEMRRKLQQEILRHENTQRALEHLAVTDELTGLYNRRALFEQAHREFNRSKRTGEPFALITLDVDHFKRVNDSYGHAAGDAVLRAVAKALTLSVREIDMAARTGGEEFTLLLPNTSTEQATPVAERSRQIISELRIPFDGRILRVTASFGVAAYCIHDEDPDATLRAADMALYTAKRQGRDQVIEAGARGV